MAMTEYFDPKDYSNLIFLCGQFLSVPEDGFEESISGYAISYPEKIAQVLDEIDRIEATSYPDEVLVTFLRKAACAFLSPGGGRSTLDAIATRLQGYHDTPFKSILYFLQLDITKPPDIDRDIRSVKQRYTTADIAALSEELQEITTEGSPEGQAYRLFTKAGREAWLGEKTAKEVLKDVLDKLLDETFR